LIHYESELERRDETIAQQAERIRQLEAENEQLKRLLTDKAESKASKKPKFTEDYSLDKNTHKKRHLAISTGRRSHEAKRDLISDSQPIYWQDADPERCICHREQFAWRLVDGKAVYLRYAIYDVPDSKQWPLPPGLRTSRSEFGIEIILVLAFLHYWIGVSIDHAREIMRFFTGIGVTDDYGAYTNLFTRHQLCWAHLIRKAIKLALQHPDEKHYAAFLDDLYDLYQQAVRYQKDRRLSVSRAQKVCALQEGIRSLCTRHGETVDESSQSEHEATFIRLQNELVDNLACLFVFVEHPQVEPTNNRSERTVRREAEIRKGGRTSKTPSGAQRRGVIMTVLASLRTRFPRFTLEHLLSEVQRWCAEGRSIFESELAELRKAAAPPSGQPIPIPSV